jgi:hypothetical protein
MTAQLKNFSPDWELHANNIVSIEEKLYKNWIGDLAIVIQQEAPYIQ